jgi:hypothetical protein
VAAVAPGVVDREALGELALRLRFFAVQLGATVSFDDDPERQAHEHHKRDSSQNEGDRNRHAVMLGAPGPIQQWIDRTRRAARSCLFGLT